MASARLRAPEGVALGCNDNESQEEEEEWEKGGGEEEERKSVARAAITPVVPSVKRRCSSSGSSWLLCSLSSRSPDVDEDDEDDDCKHIDVVAAAPTAKAKATKIMATNAADSCDSPSPRTKRRTSTLSSSSAVSRKASSVIAFERLEADCLDNTLMHRFKDVVETYTHRAAIEDVWDERIGDVRWTYGYLGLRVKLLSARIAAKALPRDQPIALYVDQGRHFILAALAVIHAGHFWTPLDPSSASDRNAHILRDSCSSVVISMRDKLGDARTLAAAADLPHARRDILLVDEVRNFPRAKSGIEDKRYLDYGDYSAVQEYGSSGAKCSFPLSDATQTPNSIAFILYTSGSSGAPKGVVYSHYSTLHNARRHINAFEIRPSDRQSLLYPTTVYGGVRDIFNTILAGACVCRYPLQTAGIAPLCTWVREKRITLFSSVATVYRQFVKAVLDEDCFYPDMRIVKVGGEAVYRTDVDMYKQAFGTHVRLSCGLGATEVGGATQTFIDYGVDVTTHRVPCGPPSEDVRILIVNPHSETRESLQQGEVGEIVVCSAGIAVGYWKQPELTEKAFATNAAGERLFYTGDLGYIDANGILVHRGRKDFQVKIDGNRVEIAEVEVAILGWNHVHEAAVFAEEIRGSLRLAAFVVPSEKGATAALDPRAIKSYLGEKLSTYLVPTHILIVNELPKLTNGKIDRKRLSYTEAAEKEAASQRKSVADGLADNGRSFRTGGGAATQAPATDKIHDVEEELVDDDDDGSESVSDAAARTLSGLPKRDELVAFIKSCWTSLLGGDESVGDHDNFYDLGGNSKTLMDFIAQLSAEYNHRFPLWLATRAATPSDMAQVVRDHLKKDGDFDGWQILQQDGIFYSFVPLRSAAGGAGTVAKEPIIYATDAGGCLLQAVAFANQFPADQPVIGLSVAPGPDFRYGYTCIDIHAAGAIFCEMITRAGIGNFHLSGFSFGGFVAHEIARNFHLRGRAKQVLHLAVLDTDASIPIGIDKAAPSRPLSALNKNMKKRWLKQKAMLHFMRMYWSSESFRTKLSDTNRMSQRYRFGYDFREPEEWLFSALAYMSFNAFIEGVMDYFIDGRPGEEKTDIPVLLFAFNHRWKSHYKPSQNRLDVLKTPFLLGWNRASSDIQVVPLPKGDHYKLLHVANIADNINAFKSALNL